MNKKSYTQSGFKSKSILVKPNRAISTVVATVLIILITVAAVTIIWAAIIPMIKEKLVSGAGCMDAQADLSIVSEQGYTCIVNNAEGNISVQVTRGSKDFDLQGIQFVVSVGGTTYSEKQAVTLNQNEGKVFSLVNSTYANATKVQIAPIVRVGNTQQICGISESAALSACQ